MNNIIKFNYKYALATLFILFSELLIVNTKGFIRHTFGDFLAVILLFYAVKTFYDVKTFPLAISILAFSFFIEFIQLFNFLDIVELSHHRVINIILGNTFSLGDLVAYTLGIITVVCIEEFCGKR